MVDPWTSVLGTLNHTQLTTYDCESSWFSSRTKKLGLYLISLKSCEIFCGKLIVENVCVGQEPCWLVVHANYDTINDDDDDDDDDDEVFVSGVHML